MACNAALPEDQVLWTALEREIETIREMGVYLSPSPYVDAVTDIAVAVTLGHSSSPLRHSSCPSLWAFREDQPHSGGQRDAGGRSPHQQ